MERLKLEELHRYIHLNNELVLIDPYQLKLTAEEFLETYEDELTSGELEIFLFTENLADIGFTEISRDENVGMIEKIFLRAGYDKPEFYQKILKELEEYYRNTRIKKLVYIGPNNKGSLEIALSEIEFLLEKEHLQMEKPLRETGTEADAGVLCAVGEYGEILTRKPLSEIGHKDRLFSFMESCMEGSAFHYKKEEVAQLIKTESDLNCLLFEGEQPVGILVSYINEKRNAQEGKKVVYIEELAVLKAHRKKGFGGRAIAFAEKKGLEKGMELARLHVYRHNENAHRLYKKLGFKEVKSIGYWAKNLEVSKNEEII